MNDDLRIQQLEHIKKTQKQHSEMEVFYKSVRRKFPVYEIPLNLLIYNKFNGRIASLVKSWEKQNRTLDASKDNDRALIEKFLFESNPGRNKTTKEDLEKRQQLRYGIVTKDGVIIDGNRRAMLLGQLAAKRNEKPGQFLAVILDDRLMDQPREIMRLETTYQLGEDEKLGYNAVEKYLKVKDLRDLGFERDEIASMMSEPRVENIEKLEQIMELMDRFLNFLTYDGIYTRLDDTEGIFVDLHQYLSRYKSRQSSMVGWSYTDQDLADLELIHFDLIRARFSGDGKEYRLLGRPSKKESVFCNEEVWKAFRDFHFDAVDNITQAEKPVDEYRRENPGKSLDELLKHRDKDWEDAVLPKIKENFGRSRRKLDDINMQNAPLELLRRAFETLRTIDTEAEAFWNDVEVEKAVAEINTLTYEFKKAIKEAKRH